YARGERARAWGFVRFFMRRQLVTTVLVVAGVMAVVLTGVEPRLRVPFVVLALMLVPVTVEGIYTHAVFGAQRYDLTTQTSTVKMALHLLASIVVVALGFDILGLVLALMLGTTVSCFMQRARAREVLAGPSVPPPAAARAEIRGYVASLAVVAVLEALVRDRSEIFFLRLLGVLALVAVLGALRKVAAASLQAVGDRHCALTATGVAVVLNLVLAFLFIPGHATAGAVLANSAAQLVASMWAFIGMARLHRARVPVRDLARIGLAAALLFAVARLVAGDSHELPRLILAAAAGAAAFLVAAV